MEVEMKRLLICMIMIFMVPLWADGTVTLLRAPQSYQGLSTDTKPTTGVLFGATFRESNTGREFIYNGSSWFQNRKYVASSQGVLAAAAASTGIAAAGYSNASVVYGGGGSGISINFVMQGFVSSMDSWFNLSTANTSVTTSIKDSTAVVLITNISYLDSIRVKATAVSSGDTVYYKCFLHQQ
jgi:hypothetical protein